MGEVRVGMFPAALRRSWPPVDPSVAEAVDQLCVGNHVSFFVGAGSDGLVSATALRAAQSELPVYVAVYLLALRHRHEIEICGVDPATRGRRMDECLRVLRGLADGSAVTSDGEFFPMRDARILPAPSTKVPLVVGGRSDAAVRRAARFGDGWLGIWVSPLRFAAVRDQIAGEATRMGRDATRFEHALNVWCGFGRSREAARRPLAAQMQAFYQSPFEPFEGHSPYGTPEDVAEQLSPYLDAGCSTFNVIPCADDDETAVSGVRELRTMLTSVAGRTKESR